ncbi:trypsin-like serine protease [Streptomyces lavendulae]|uniref:S1 family peptidase n=1 Tax=Streptomyces lavendulae TaxID=1914 RepID=UPI0033C1E5F7
MSIRASEQADRQAHAGSPRHADTSSTRRTRSLKGWGDQLSRFGDTTEHRWGNSKSLISTVTGVSELRPHPTAEYTPDGLKGVDLVLLKLDQPVANQPLPLGEESPAIGTPLRLPGWGFTSYDERIEPERLQEITLPLTQAHEHILEMINADRGINAGDSGGPAVAATPDGWSLIGVTTGLGVDESGARVSGYVNVTQFLDWIRQTIG